MTHYDHMDFQNKVTSPAEFPEGDHLALIEFRSVHHEGDERSRTNPGHGYPTHTTTEIDYFWFEPKDREHWLYFIEHAMGLHQYSSVRPFIALEYGIKVNPQISISIGK